MMMVVNNKELLSFKVKKNFKNFDLQAKLGRIRRIQWEIFRTEVTLRANQLCLSDEMIFAWGHEDNIPLKRQLIAGMLDPFVVLFSIYKVSNVINGNLPLNTLL